MKVTIRPKAEAQERVTLRFPASLKRRMDETHTLAERKGADYYGSIADIVASANEEIHARLLEMPDLGDQAGDKVGTTSGGGSGDKFGDKSSDRLSASAISAESPVRHINGTTAK
jgi:hypothetical protein